MAKNLVIVESPAKAKTIKKFLGASYDVIASNGHVRDMPKSQMGIDIEHDYEPHYITIRGKGELLAQLRKAVKKADKIYLATDPDREGEAISWHLMQALKTDTSKMHRITFNEVTKTAVKASIKQARELDMNLVDAQQARRMLDRMVGYTISPLLWAKVKRGLSAGRVQSVALRIICDREEEINLFIPQEYWSLEALLDVKGSKKPLEAKLIGNKEQKIEIHSEEEMNEILSYLKGKEFTVEGVKVTERLKKSPLPFTTSTLQQDASSKLNFAPQKTMRIAQQLYEGVEIKGRGSIGLISYLRTDSTRISDEAAAAAKDYIIKNFGEDYTAGIPRADKPGKKIQDAHEAIRPTDITLSPAAIKDQLSREQFRLYQLIYNRFLASQMAEAVDHFSYDRIRSLQKLKQEIPDEPVQRICDALEFLEELPVEEAFLNLEDEREYFLKKNMEERKNYQGECIALAKMAAYLPMFLLIILKLVVPFVAEGLSELHAYSQSMTGFFR